MAAVASLVAGLILAAITDTLEELPGLLLLVPAAIAVKGNIFGALGSRLGTAIHAGTFRLSGGRNSVMMQNAVASVGLSLVLGVALAVMAKGVALAFNVSPTMSLADFVVISALGCLIAAFVVLAFTLATTAGAVRFGWDLDNVVAPMVTVAGDVVTLPSLVVAAELAGVAVVTPSVAWTLAVMAAASMVWGVCGAGWRWCGPSCASRSRFWSWPGCSTWWPGSRWRSASMTSSSSRSCSCCCRDS